MTAHTRTCPGCGQPFTWTPASPRQRFCSPRCRWAWHKANRRRAPRDHHRSGGAEARGNPGTGHEPCAETGNEGRGATLTAIHDCPHCRQPIAVLALLMPPAAARVTPPTPGITRTRDKPTQNT